MLLNFPQRLTAFGQWHMSKASRTKTTHLHHDTEECLKRNVLERGVESSYLFARHTMEGASTRSSSIINSTRIIDPPSTRAKNGEQSVWRIHEGPRQDFANQNIHREL